MKQPVILLILTVIAISFHELRAQPAGSAPRGAPLPTTQQIQQMLDSKQYPEVLKESQRILTLKGAAAKDVDKFDVLMLRGEAQLQLKQQGPAVESYTKAIKETSDPTKAGVPNQFLTIPGGKHGGFNRAEMLKAFATIQEFLNKHNLVKRDSTADKRP